jgi:hypothetical protein
MTLELALRFPKSEPGDTPNRIWIAIAATDWPRKIFRVMPL